VTAALWAGLVAAAVGAAFFSLGELAILSTSRIRLRQWVRRTLEGQAWVRSEDVIERPHRLLSPLLVGRALAAVAAATIAARIAAGGMEAGIFATAAVTALLLAPGLYLLETLAGAVAKARGHQLLPAVTIVIRACSWAFRPVVLAADALTQPLLRAVGASLESPAVAGRRVLEALLDESERAGVVEPAEREIIAGVFEFGRTPVAAILHPIEEMETAPAGARAREISETIRRTGRSRIPIHSRRDPRRIVGMVHVFDLFKLDPDERPHPRRVVAVTPATPCDELLVVMKRRRLHLAVVVEEGRTLGMVAMEDLVEVLIGEIREERHGRRGG
jgi:CBS domain containing-hemolysin-like protein